MSFSQTETALASGDCGSNDLLYRLGFEDPPGYQIRFTSPFSALFTEIGQSQVFTIEFVDAQEQPVDPSGIEWCLEDDSLLQLSPDGMSATVEATDFDVTSVDLVIRDAASGTEARALIMLASLHDNAVVVDEDSYISGSFPAAGETTIVQLVRTPLTESLEAGMVIGTNGGDGLLVRILSVTLFTDYVEVEVEAAGLSDLFAELSIDTVSAPVNIQGEQEPGGAASLVARTPYGGVEVSGQDLLQASNCSGGVLYTDAPARFKFDANPRLHFILDLSLQSIVNQRPDRFELGSYGDFTATLSFDFVDISVAPNIQCQWKSTPIPLPVHPPIFGISIGMAAVPIWGFSAGVQSSLLPSARFAVPPLSFRSDYAGWIGMVPHPASPTTLNEVYYNGNSYGQFIWGEAETPPPPEDRAAFELGAFGYIGLNIEPSLIVGGTPFGFKLYDIRFGARYDLAIDEPFDPLHKEYTGPSWNLRLGGESRWNTSAGGNLQKIMDVVFPSWAFGSFDFSQPLWEDFVPFAASPSVALSTECAPPNCNIDPQRQFDELRYEVTPSQAPGPKWPFLAKADLVGFKDGAQTAAILDSDIPLAGQEVSGWWNPEESHLGSWQVRGLMKDIDHVSLWKPYPTAMAIAEVVRTHQLLIDKQGTGGEILTATQGKVVSTDNDIDCGDTCGAFVVADAAYQFEAQDSGGWKFVKWADASDACPGSMNPVCQVTMDSDKTAKAVFYEDLNYVLVYGTPTNSFNGFEAQGEIRKGDVFTAYPSRYEVGLKLDGQLVEIADGVFYARIDLFNASEFTQYGPEDYPPTSEPAMDFVIELQDFTNSNPDTGLPKNVFIPIKLRISNEAYRRLAGFTANLGGRYAGDTFTLDPFETGQLQGNMTYVKATGETVNGIWSMIAGGGAYTYLRSDCSSWTPGADNPLVVYAGRARINANVTFPNLGAGGGHVWTLGNERDHFCQGFEDSRIITNDH